LATTGLVARVLDLMAKSFQQFERGDANFREEGVDVTRDEQPDAHL
jgi:hypothetical protein